MQNDPGSRAASDGERIAADQAAYLATRFPLDPRRDRAWHHIAAYLGRWWDPNAAVLDVGAGYCSFINQVQSRRRVAVDLHEQLGRFAAHGVETIRASATDLSPLPSDTFDVVFASNLLEHLTREDIAVALREFSRVMRSGGRLILMQPNYRLCADIYFDDYTHLTPLSDRSLPDLLAANGFDVLRVTARFLPFSLKSRFSGLTFLIPLYLRSPIRPAAGQMLVVAEPSAR